MKVCTAKQQAGFGQAQDHSAHHARYSRGTPLCCYYRYVNFLPFLSLILLVFSWSGSWDAAADDDDDDEVLERPDFFPSELQLYYQKAIKSYKSCHTTYNHAESEATSIRGPLADRRKIVQPHNIESPFSLCFEMLMTMRI